MKPLARLLSQFVQYRSHQASKDEIATQLGMSRRSLYNACQPDKNVESFTVGTLLKITSLFPMTVIISRGKVEVFRWDTIQSHGKWSEDDIESYQKQHKDVIKGKN